MIFSSEKPITERTLFPDTVRAASNYLQLLVFFWASHGRRSSGKHCKTTYPSSVTNSTFEWTPRSLLDLGTLSCKQYTHWTCTRLKYYWQDQKWSYLLVADLSRHLSPLFVLLAQGASPRSFQTAPNLLYALAPSVTRFIYPSGALICNRKSKFCDIITNCLLMLGLREVNSILIHLT